jgi:hypothetical protein
MKLLLDINDDKAAFILELLKNFKFVKSTPLTPYDAKVLERLKDAVEEVNEIKAGNNYSQSLSSFLDEL